MASVTAAHFSHATAAMARTFSSPRMTTVRLPVTLRTEEIVAGLNNLQPDFMTVYPSVLHALAHEAAAGRSGSRRGGSWPGPSRCCPRSGPLQSGPGG